MVCLEVLSKRIRGKEGYMRHVDWPIIIVLPAVLLATIITGFFLTVSVGLVAKLLVGALW